MASAGCNEIAARAELFFFRNRVSNAGMRSRSGASARISSHVVTI